MTSKILIDELKAVLTGNKMHDIHHIVSLVTCNKEKQSREGSKMIQMEVFFLFNTKMPILGIEKVDGKKSLSVL